MIAAVLFGSLLRQLLGLAFTLHHPRKHSNMLSKKYQCSKRRIFLTRRAEWSLDYLLVATLLEPLGWTVLVGVVLLGTLILNVVLVVHVIGTLCGVLAGLVAVVFIHTVSLGELIDLSTNEAGEKLLRKLMVHNLAYYGNAVSCETKTLDIFSKGMDQRTFLALVVLVEFKAFKGSRTGHQFVGELALVVWVWVVPSSVLLIHLLM